ncbi:MAG: type III secretion system export apparatus subunit SctR [Polyangiales bacterium]|nr:type III secretion system export apparatus subunit SctR [Myxococcales bacterium]
MEGFASQPFFSVLMLAALGLLPFVFMVTTSFVKISVVFSVLRNALGTGQVPSGMIITALAAILTFYVMSPVIRQASVTAAPALARLDLGKPLAGDNLDALFDTVDLGKEPFRAFLTKHAGERERGLFYELAKAGRTPAEQADIGSNDWLVVLPAFLITELAEAFQIGFLVFVPFLLVDMVIANVLLALGMHMLSPTTVSLPFKLLLFVLVDGWYLLSKALVLGYA